MAASSAWANPCCNPTTRLGAVGRPLPDKEVRILDADGSEVPVGEIGEICMRGGFMTGYWGKPEKTAEALRGGWLHSGDAGVIDRDGYLTMRGRFAELIKVGGETWFPRDVEEALCAQAGIKEAAVVGLPDATLGQRPVGYVTTNGDGIDLACSEGGDCGRCALRSLAAHADQPASLSHDADRQDCQSRAARACHGGRVGVERKGYAHPLHLLPPFARKLSRRHPQEGFGAR